MKTIILSLAICLTLTPSAISATLNNTNQNNQESNNVVAGLFGDINEALETGEKLINGNISGASNDNNENSNSFIEGFEEGNGQETPDNSTEPLTNNSEENEPDASNEFNDAFPSN